MRGSTTLATLLLGWAQACTAADAAGAPGITAAAAQAARSERPAATVHDRDSDAEQDQDQDQDSDRKPRRPPAAEPASAPSTPPVPQPIFIISCNASGCNDNQGRFLTRSGPKRLVGPNGLSCQSMGGNWQCSPGNPP